MTEVLYYLLTPKRNSIFHHSKMHSPVYETLFPTLAVISEIILKWWSSLESHIASIPKFSFFMIGYKSTSIHTKPTLLQIMTFILNYVSYWSSLFHSLPKIPSLIQMYPKQCLSFNFSRSPHHSYEIWDTRIWDTLRDFESTSWSITTFVASYIN